nr:DUF2815 family protein [Schaalia sp. lx-100]
MKNVRLSYVNVFEPRQNSDDQKPKYSVSIIIPKTDQATIAQVEKAVKQALEDGKDRKFNGKIPSVKALKLPLRDGDEERDDEAYADSMFLNANSIRKPDLVDGALNPVLDPDEIYSGIYANVLVSFYAYSVNGNRGVAVGLQAIQKVRDGQALGGVATKAGEAFDLIETETENYDFL